MDERVEFLKNSINYTLHDGGFFIFLKENVMNYEQLTTSGVQWLSMHLNQEQMMKYQTRGENPIDLNALSLTFVAGAARNLFDTKLQGRINAILGYQREPTFVMGYYGEEDGDLRVAQFEMLRSGKREVERALDVSGYMADLTLSLASESKFIRVTMPPLREMVTERYQGVDDEQRYMRLSRALNLRYSPHEGLLVTDLVLRQ